MAYLLFGMLLAGGFLLLLHWWASAEVASAKRGLFWAVIAASLLLGLVLYARAGAVSALMPGAFALWRMRGAFRSAASFAGKRQGQSTKQQRVGPMSSKEAHDVLGLEQGATTADINSAYKRLMSQCHPDKGGTDWMAAQLNEAKRTLLPK